MISPMESTSTFNPKQAPNCGRYAAWAPALRKLSAYAAAVVSKLRNVAPYAVIELVLPGGSLIALALWFYRRQKKVPNFYHSLETLL
jgi:hypothetical protein